MQEEAKIFEQHGKANRSEASQDQILCEGIYADPQDQALYEHILSLCHTAALNARDRAQEPEKKELNQILWLNKAK